MTFVIMPNDEIHEPKVVFSHYFCVGNQEIFIIKINNN